MRGHRLFERPTHVFSTNSPLMVVGSLPSYAVGAPYEGRLDILNAVGRSRVEIVEEETTLPEGATVHVDNFNQQVVVKWPAYVPPDTERFTIINGDFQQGTLEGWTDLRGNSWGVELYDRTTPGNKDVPYQAPDGNLAAYMRGVGRGDHILESMRYAVQPGLPISARSLWYQGPSNKDNNNLWTAFGIWRNDYFMGEVRGDRIHDRTNKARHWSTVNLVVPETATHVTVRLIAYRRNNRNREIVVDDVETAGLSYSVGTPAPDRFCLTVKVTDSASRVAYWSGCVEDDIPYLFVTRRGGVLLNGNGPTLSMNRHASWLDTDYVVVGMSTSNNAVVSIPGLELLKNELHPSGSNRLQIFGGFVGTATSWTASWTGTAASAGIASAFSNISEEDPVALVGDINWDTFSRTRDFGADTVPAHSGHLPLVVGVQNASDGTLSMFPSVASTGWGYNGGRQVQMTRYDISRDANTFRSPVQQVTSSRPGGAAPVLLNRKVGGEGNMPAPAAPNFEPLESYLAETAVGWSYVVLQNGSVVDGSVGGFARQPAAGGVAFSNSMLFPVASISKVVTELALRIMRRDGLIDFDQTAFHYIGGDYTFGSGAQDMTIRDLLAMQHGTNTLYNLAGAYPAAMQTWLNSTFTNPGEWYRYDNGAFAVLQAVMEKLVGSYHDYVQNEVFAPVGIFGATSEAPGMPVRMHSGLTDSGGVDPFAVPATAVGGWWLSMNELTRLSPALRTSVLLSNEERMEMLSDRYRMMSWSNNRGEVHFHDGALIFGGREIRSWWYRLTDGYDVFCYWNSPAPNVASLIRTAINNT